MLRDRSALRNEWYLRWCCCSTPDPRELSVSALTDDRGRIDPAAAGTAAPGGGGPGGGECDGGLTWRMRAETAESRARLDAAAEWRDSRRY